jgi:hypothetical protein
MISTTNRESVLLMILEDATQGKKNIGAVFRGLVDGTCFIKHTTMFPV